MSNTRTQNLVLELNLADELKALAYARNTTIDQVLADLIRRAASDSTGGGGCRRAANTHRQGVRQVVA